MENGISANGELSRKFFDPVATELMQTGSVLIWICLFVYCWRQSKRAGELTFPTLIFLSTTSMFWLEFYGDWGAYLLYNPAFVTLPWGATWWTTPHKPAFMPFSYGWFYLGVALIQLALIDKVKARFPNMGHVARVFVVAFPIFYAWDVGLESTASMTGWWVYLYHIGPMVSLAKGDFPLLHPVLLYAFSGFLFCLTLTYRDANGRVWFERYFGVSGMPAGAARETKRLIGWSAVMALQYMITFVVPLNLVRETLGVANAIVP